MNDFATLVTQAFFVLVHVTEVSVIWHLTSKPRSKAVKLMLPFSVHVEDAYVYVKLLWRVQCIRLIDRLISVMSLVNSIFLRS